MKESVKASDVFKEIKELSSKAKIFLCIGGGLLFILGLVAAQC